MDLSATSFADYLALAGFPGAWVGYALLVDHGPLAGRTLSAAMDRQRRQWVEMMQANEIRIADINILSGLQNGTAFFASASILGIGGCLAILGSSESVASVFQDFAPSTDPGGALFEAKIIGLALIFVYAFFKFGWAYRLINYSSILVGALPPPPRGGEPETDRAVGRATRLLRLSGRNFNRGQRAFYFGLAYIGWLGGPWPLLGASTFVLAVLVHRQFWSRAARAMAS